MGVTMGRSPIQLVVVAGVLAIFVVTWQLGFPSKGKWRGDCVASMEQSKNRNKSPHPTPLTARVKANHTINVIFDSDKFLSQTDRCVDILQLVPQNTYLVDHPSKIKITSSPKAGATLAAQLAFRTLGLMRGESLTTSYIHFYRTDVFMKEKDHQFVPSKSVCSGTDWVCIKIVRKPLDRVVSSWIHMMTTGWYNNGLPKLQEAMVNKSKPLQNASFAEYITSLTMMDQALTFGGDHFLPQTSIDDDYNPYVYHLLTETIQEGVGAVGRETGLYINASGLSSPHYVKKSKSGDNALFPDMSSEGVVFDHRHKVQKVPYDAYLVNPTVNAMICRLFCRDIALYAQSCKSELLRHEPQSQLACAEERARTLRVCGEQYNFYD